MDVGLVCDTCDFFNAMTAVTCASCGTSLSLGAAPGKSAQRPVSGPISGAVSAQQAAQPAPAAGPRRCPACNADITGNHKFCGQCGTRLDGPAPAPAAGAAPTGERRTMFFSAMQAPR